MSKNELLAQAKALGIKGRHEMTKENLETAVRQAQMIAETKPQKKLVKNTNVPWRRKYYYLDVDRYEAVSEELKKVASQVQLMLKYMYDEGITNEDRSEQGVTIGSGAIAKGYIKTKIEPHVLVAYYRSTMEKYGLVFAGYNLDK